MQIDNGHPAGCGPSRSNRQKAGWKAGTRLAGARGLRDQFRESGFVWVIVGRVAERDFRTVQFWERPSDRTASTKEGEHCSTSSPPSSSIKPHHRPSPNRLIQSPRAPEEARDRRKPPIPVIENGLKAFTAPKSDFSSPPLQQEECMLLD
ncbi:hypothetical protein QC761_0036630 [Podospora bellae-mahoneyi]|uniref:Uncharacterized protein n=1 Tax=Podospora bellae-mahoneyi TaxID=2093777 RepID=A0ABR0FSH7_9PEZI|nr:hypothetical protein QC761_0036630 [Podospora bellae-mahoneyi]